MVSDNRIDILDGWRALSILAVLAGHLLPLGPGAWGLNGAVAASGMAIFFTLSGFLITRLLLDDPRVPQFLVRRLFRIVPLAWLAIAVLAVANQATLPVVVANLGFFANLPPAQLMHGGEHLWSLCVEVQFYAFAAIIVFCAGRRALYLLPVLALIVTGLRVYATEAMSIVTWHRVEEILAGTIVALLYHHGVLKRIAEVLPRSTTIILLPILILCSHPVGGVLMFARPYVAAAAVGVSIYAAPALMRQIFHSQPAKYIATTSYALYVIHGMLSVTWLGSGDTFVKYAKRPLLFILTFALAHVSTFIFEAKMITIGKRTARRFGGKMIGTVAPESAPR